MALGFTSHYKQGEQAFGSLTQSAYIPDTEATGTVASSHSGIIVGQNAAFFNKNINKKQYDRYFTFTTTNLHFKYTENTL